MTNQEIRELLAIFNESGTAEMEVQRGENRVRFRRAMAGDFVVNPGVVPPSAYAGTAAPVHPHATMHAGVAAPPTQGQTAGGASSTEKRELVTAPIVGTFYECPSPGSAAFVKVGDSIEKGQVLCIIESMKLMNEIEAEVSGTIIEKLVDNGKPVEYGQPLFAIRPR